MAKTILIVDDSSLALEVSEFLINSLGFDSFTCQNGLEALEILNQYAIDLAIIDINMPGMDGYSLIRKIRADKYFGEIPIIISTTESEARDKHKGFESGADAYLIKPVNPDEMVSQINLLIGSPTEGELDGI
jgi:DNA-binding response OmpR family regulator